MIRLYSIYDRLVPAHEQLFFAASDGVAARIVIESATGERNRLRQHSADFDLYRLAAIDQSSGLISPEMAPVYISSVKTIIDSMLEMEKLGHASNN